MKLQIGFVFFVLFVRVCDNLMIINKRRKQVNTSCVKQSGSPSSTLHTCWGEPDQRSTNNTNYYDTPEYVIDVLGRAMSKTNIRHSQRRNYRHVVTNIIVGSSWHRGYQGEMNPK